MKKGLLIICALAVVLGITSARWQEQARSRRPASACTSITRIAERRTSTFTNSKYGHKTCIVGKQGAKVPPDGPGRRVTGSAGREGRHGASGASGITYRSFTAFRGIGPDTSLSRQWQSCRFGDRCLDSPTSRQQPDGSSPDQGRQGHLHYESRGLAAQPSRLQHRPKADGGVTGTLYGSRPSLSRPTRVRPLLLVPSPCSLTTAVTSANVAQNDAFMASFFPDGVAAPDRYDLT